MRVSSFPHGRESRVRGQRTRWGPGLGMGLRKGLLVGRGDQTNALIPNAHTAEWARMTHNEQRLIANESRLRANERG